MKELFYKLPFQHGIKEMEIESERKEVFNQEGEGFSFLQYPVSPDKPVLHFAHANGFNAFTYDEFLKLLSLEFSVYAMDARGHGYTNAKADPSQFTSWDPYYQDLVNFLETIPHPAFLSGHSLGAAISLFVAASHPQLVKGLVLIEPVIPRGLFSFIIQILQILRMSHKIPIAQKAMRRKAYFHSMQEAALYYEGRRIFSKWEKIWIENYLAGGTETKSDGCLSLTCSPAWESKTFSVTNAHSWDIIDQVECPILLIHGGESRIFQLCDVAAFKKRLPATTVIKNRNASHFVPMEFPQETAEQIAQFCLEIQ
ncbi:MAG: alpha/beta hydrolase [SAR324 cluster bacterium]|nr:alpha/beta hydrolase [SAR324 cluster bacterium]